ncbi:MAG: hypothetical protein IJU37_01655 [Desulfovibrio sp.]|nr:hypothetical protein [Desulfovibrio sp.]
MEAFLDSAALNQYRHNSICQRRWGMLCALLLGVALVCVLDGLQSLRRGESDLLELLPGTSAAVSGPVAARNPVLTDVKARIVPEEAALGFELEGFFTGYVFGSAMWRGKIFAEENVRPGRYTLRVSFRGTPANAIQRFPVCVYADATAMRVASLSLVNRYAGMNPFLLAATFCAAGLLVGLVVFFLGQRRIVQLAHLACAEVVMVRPEAHGKRLWALVYTLRTPALGVMCSVFDVQGVVLGRAYITGVRKGTLELFTNDDMENVCPGCLALLQSRSLEH